MNAVKIGYWVSTGLFAFALGSGGVMHLIVEPTMAENMSHVGHSEVFMRIIGTWKVLGVLALLAPGLPKLKEWAYAGFTFLLTGATATHLAYGDPLAESLMPLFLLGVAAISYALRPEGRRLTGKPPGA